MPTSFAAITVLAATANLAAAVIDFMRPRWLLANMASARVPRSWLFSLGALKAAGAVGLLLGFAAPAIGVAAAIGLVAYFVGAVAALVRAHHWRMIASPSTFLLLAMAALAARLAL
jgi:hypothetical protein